jgi:TRAP transporter 4TM/12TM fusion protein
MSNDPLHQVRHGLFGLLAVLLALGTAFELAAPSLPPVMALTLFVGLASTLCFLHFPISPVFRHSRWALLLDLGLAFLALVLTSARLLRGDPSAPTAFVDQALAVVLLVCVLEGIRRTVGSTLSTLILLVLAYELWHGGAGTLLIQSLLRPDLAPGAALRVTFGSVFLLVLFGALLEELGVGDLLAGWARRLPRATVGAAAQRALLASALRGLITRSSAPLTRDVSQIPQMRRDGFPVTLAAAIEAVSCAGRSLVPPILGVGAFLMLHTLSGQGTTLLGVMRAAFFPGLIFYGSLLLVVHFRARHLLLAPPEDLEEPRSASVELPVVKPPREVGALEGWILVVSFAVLLGLIAYGFNLPYAALAASFAALALATLRPRTRPNWRRLLTTCENAAIAVVPLVLVATGVAVVLGAVDAHALPAAAARLLEPLARYDLLLALLVAMAGSLLAGMGMPAMVGYLLPALLLAPSLVAAGVLPLAAHFFVYYFGLLAVITPPGGPVSDAAAKVARAERLPTAITALRLSLVGFALPYLFVYRPQLLMLDAAGGKAPWSEVAIACGVALLGIVPLAAADSAYFGRPIGPAARIALLAIAALIFYPAAGPPSQVPITWVNVAGVALLGIAALAYRRPSPDGGDSPQQAADTARSQS